jgi:uncharacterized membrane protein
VNRLIVATAYLIAGLQLAPSAAAHATPFFVGVPGASVFYDVSGNGLVAVGEGSINQALRWEGGSLAVLTGLFRAASGASFDGSAVIAGSRLWRNGTVTTVNGPGGVPALTLDDISGDGSTAVGRYGAGGAFFWNGSASTDIAFPAAMTSILGLAVSGDGTRIAFTASPNGGNNRFAYVWEAGVATPLGGAFSEVRGISADGRVVVGWAQATPGAPIAGFRWEAGVMEPLPMQIAWDASADGSVIVGQLGPNPMVWVDGETFQLEDILSGGAGLDLTGWQLGDIWAVSDDGLTFVGQGVNPQGQPQAWIAHVDALVVPEPQTLGLVAAGLLGLSAARRRATPRPPRKEKGRPPEWSAAP